MESLSDTKWDVLISGTDLKQSLLALALSRSGKKVLHVDRNKIYGGSEAALSLQDADEWKAAVADACQNPLYPFESARITGPAEQDGTESAKLGSSRSYSLSLSPQLIYTQSRLIPVLVSSQVYQTLEFQAVGSWWVAQPAPHSDTTVGNANVSIDLTRVPSSREDVFADKSIGVRSKRALMKFLRHLMQGNDDEEEAEVEMTGSFAELMTNTFHLPQELHQPLLALSLSPLPTQDTPAKVALDRISRHMKSIGVFGPGFGSLVVKWGGLSEVAQTACRALAVGGGVYVLGRHIEGVTEDTNSDIPSEANLSVSLSDGENIKTDWVVRPTYEVPDRNSMTGSMRKSIRGIYVISSSLEQLFTSTAEGAPSPAAAVVAFPSEDPSTGPIYLIVHSSDTGECPHGQCVVYASISVPVSDTVEEIDPYSQKLDAAVQSLLDSNAPPTEEDQTPSQRLWSMYYVARGLDPVKSMTDEATPLNPQAKDSDDYSEHYSEHVLTIAPPSIDLAFDDTILDEVKRLWLKIMGNEVNEADFMKFESREGADMDE